MGIMAVASYYEWPGCAADMELDTFLSELQRGHVLQYNVALLKRRIGLWARNLVRVRR